MIKAVLFDMDGVLVKSERAWFGVLQKAGQRFGERVVTWEEFIPQFGQGTAADVEAFELRCTVPELDAFYADTFAEFGAHVWVNPEAAPLLEALQQRGLGLAVVTNTVSRLASEVLRGAKLLHLFQHVACADQVPLAKPAPDLPLHACKLLGVSPAEAWMVGDSRFDRMAAGSAGVHFIGFEQDGDARVDSLAALLPLVDGTLGK